MTPSTDDIPMKPVKSDPIEQCNADKIVNKRADQISVKIGTFTYRDNKFTSGSYSWLATTLVEAAAQCEVYDLPLYSIDFGVQPWCLDNMLDFAEHVKRVWECEMQYPIILDRHGYIIDGWHRVMKAILLGHKVIAAKRLLKMPEPDEIKEK